MSTFTRCPYCHEAIRNMEALPYLADCDVCGRETKIDPYDNALKISLDNRNTFIVDKRLVCGECRSAIRKNIEATLKELGQVRENDFYASNK